LCISKHLIAKAAKAVDRLAWLKKMEPMMAFILAAWKNLAQSQAGEQVLDTGSLKNLREVADMYCEHREDWKLFKKEVLEAGQVHLVEKLVRPFLEESPLYKK
jgi:hypothetical protein